ncbi:MAG: carbohydrate porin [Puniceicoccales bacterium]
MQPDFQVVVNPNGNSDRDPVYLVGIRNVVNF